MKTELVKWCVKDGAVLAIWKCGDKVMKSKYKGEDSETLEEST